MSQPGMLVLAAHASELAPWLAGLALQAQAGYWLHPSGRLALAEMGVGPVNAALGACRWINQLQPQALLLVGTAGCYPGATLALGSAAQAAGVRQLDAACELGLARYPMLGQGERLLPLAWPGGLPALQVGCLWGLTLDAALATTLAIAHHLQLENMEAYALGKAAQAFGLHWSAVLGVSNQVGPGGHEQWKQHREAAQNAVFQACLPQIRVMLEENP